MELSLSFCSTHWPLLSKVAKVTRSVIYLWLDTVYHRCFRKKKFAIVKNALTMFVFRKQSCSCFLRPLKYECVVKIGAKTSHRLTGIIVYVNGWLLWWLQGILKGEVSLYHWPPFQSMVWNQLYDNRNFLFLIAKQTNPNQSNMRSTVQWYFPF